LYIFAAITRKISLRPAIIQRRFREKPTLTIELCANRPSARKVSA
jgi:hypothetical protein